MICGECRKDVEPHWRFCMNCGHEIIMHVDPDIVMELGGPMNKIVWMWVTVVVCVIAWALTRIGG